ncbi:thioredoxin-disulfide reductase [Jonquetella sp. BV3C21]|nr:thioredoxin-disulfide reductase [Jonquetella sp. BV3C21]
MKMEQRDLVIIGGGPAGLAAAVYGMRTGLKTAVLERGNFGGAINKTEEIENYPGVAHASGPEIGKMLKDHAMKFNAEFVDCTVKSLDCSGKTKIIKTDAGDFEAKAVILATGAEFKKLGFPGELEFGGKGVSYCATCDANFFEGCDVAVIGGGNTAVEESCYLTGFASKVYIVHRRDQFRADQMAVDRLMKNDKIERVMDSVVDSIQGDDFVNKLVVKNVKTGELREIAVEGVFMFVGMEPNNQLVDGLVDTVKGGWIKVDENMATSVPGLFAAGDVRDTPLRQVITAASDGAVAAMAAHNYIVNNF